jgi:hypothetical protein
MSEDRDSLTPVDRPLMRSDLNDMRESIHRLSQTVVNGYEEAKRARAEPRALTFACFVLTLVSVGSALASLSARDVAVRAAHAAQVRP